MGILYIGASMSLPDRVASLRKAANAAYRIGPYTDPTVHPCGRKLASNNKLRSMFQYRRLCITVEQCRSGPEDFEMKQGHYQLEWSHLQSYCELYGEFPPLNG